MLAGPLDYHTDTVSLMYFCNSNSTNIVILLAEKFEIMQLQVKSPDDADPSSNGDSKAKAKAKAKGKAKGKAKSKASAAAGPAGRKKKTKKVVNDDTEADDHDEGEEEEGLDNLSEGLSGEEDAGDL